jgi:hypothetical protein
MLRRIGRPLSRTARTYALQPEPTGGPPWGVLVYRTTTGTVCEHPGRVVDGRVGILDAHGGLHPWPADASGCGLGEFNLHVVAAQGGVFAWGGASSCGVPRGVLVRMGQRPATTLCSPDLTRTLIEGVLDRRGHKPNGAEPISVTFQIGRSRFTESTPFGAYAFVIKGEVTLANEPTETVAYSDGSREVQPGPSLPGRVIRARVP